MSRSGRIEGIDVLRGFAVLLVMLSHAFPLLGGSGILGVLIFFTLSGYLITGNLMKDLRLVSRIRYGLFYRNRALRLLPALILLMLGLTVLAFLQNPTQDRQPILISWLVALSYTGNLPFPHGALNIPHLWTLATEEQFYLFWPLVLTLGFRFKRIWLTVLVSAVGIIAGLLICLMVLRLPLIEVYFLPTSWGIALVVGASARLWQSRVARLLTPARLAWSFPITVALFVGACFSPNPAFWPASYLVGGPVAALLSVVMIFGVKEWQSIPTMWLRPLLNLGTISYAAYLWNYPIAERLKDVGPSPLLEVLSLPLTVLAATISWWAVERPANAWRAHLDSRRARVPEPHHVRGDLAGDASVG